MVRASPFYSCPPQVVRPAGDETGAASLGAVSSQTTARAGLDPGVPSVAQILPVAALAAANALEAVHRFDAHDVFRHLVAELALDPQPQRRAVPNRQHLAVHVVGQDGLGMERVIKVDALVVFALGTAGRHRIGASKYDVA